MLLTVIRGGPLLRMLMTVITRKDLVVKNTSSVPTNRVDLSNKSTCCPPPPCSASHSFEWVLILYSNRFVGKTVSSWPQEFGDSSDSMKQTIYSTKFELSPKKIQRKLVRSVFEWILNPMFKEWLYSPKQRKSFPLERVWPFLRRRENKILNRI